MIEKFEVIPFYELGIHKNAAPAVGSSAKSNDNTVFYITIGLLTIVMAVTIYNIVKIQQSAPNLEDHD